MWYFLSIPEFIRGMGYVTHKRTKILATWLGVLSIWQDESSHAHDNINKFLPFSIPEGLEALCKLQKLERWPYDS